MATTGRTLTSASSAANTGLHSTADIAGVGTGANFTVFMFFKSTGSNANTTLWADENGGCQIWYSSALQRVYARYGRRATSGNYVAATNGAWNALAVRMGPFMAGIGQALIECFDISADALRTASYVGSIPGAVLIDDGGVQYVLGDDAGGAATDGGFDGKVHGLALISGHHTLSQLGFNTATKLAKDFDATPEAALIYALRGQTAGVVGADNSGNGNDFTVESGGVVLDEADLPPGISLPAATGSSVSGAVTAPAATASGTAGVVRYATSAAGAPPATAAVSGSVTRQVSGGVSVAPATAAGAVSVTRAAVGAVSAPPAVSAAVASVTRSVTGATVAPAASASGAAEVQGVISVSGAVIAPAASSAAAASVTRIVTGATIAPAASASGAAEVQGVIIVSGAVIAPAASAVAAASVTRIASSDAFAPAGSASGVATVARLVSGAITAPPAQASGFVIIGGISTETPRARIVSVLPQRRAVVVEKMNRTSTVWPARRTVQA